MLVFLLIRAHLSARIIIIKWWCCATVGIVLCPQLCMQRHGKDLYQGQQIHLLLLIIFVVILVPTINYSLQRQTAEFARGRCCPSSPMVRKARVVMGRDGSMRSIIVRGVYGVDTVSFNREALIDVLLISPRGGTRTQVLDFSSLCSCSNLSCACSSS